MTDVIILCGGRGIRMLEETEIRPKPMVEIGGKPMLWHIMQYYAAFGFRRFLLAIGYRGEMIQEYFAQHPLIVEDDPPAEVLCIETGQIHLKGSRIKQLEPYLRGDLFHLTYGDGLCTVDLQALEAYHRSHGAMGTVTGVRPPSRFGELTIEGEQVVRFEEKPQLRTGFINGGFFVLNREFLGYLSADLSCDFEFGALQQLAADGRLRVWRHEGFWQCMDTVRERDYLHGLCATGKAEWQIWASTRKKHSAASTAAAAS